MCTTPQREWPSPSVCLSGREKTNNTTWRIQSTVQFHFTSASVPRIGSGTYGQIPRPVDLMEIDQTSPGSHTVLALIRLQLSIAIYSLEVKLSNPFWVNPAFWCRPIDLLSAVLLLIYLPWANVFIWWIPRQTHIKAVDHHLIRFQWQKKKKNLWFRFGIVLDCIAGPSCSWHIPPEKTPYGYLKLSLAAEAPAEQRSNFVFM